MNNGRLRNSVLLGIIVVFVGCGSLPFVVSEGALIEGKMVLGATFSESRRTYDLGIKHQLKDTFESGQEKSRGAFGGVVYGPFRDHEGPGFYPTSDELWEDIAFIRNLTGSLRIYELKGTLMEIPEICQAYNLSCYVGAWISDDEYCNERELQRLLEVESNNLSVVKALIVGNEVLLRGELSEAEFIEIIERVKANTTLPVTTGETWNVWMSHPQLASAVDFLLVHVHPYWEGIGVDGAAQHVIDVCNDLNETYEKRVVIGETGWPSKGLSYGAAVPSEANQKTFFEEFLPLAESTGIDYFLFEVFDETWKVITSEVEAHWGIFLSNGSVKPLLKSLIPPDAQDGFSREPRDRRVPLPWIVYEDPCSYKNRYFSSGWMGELASWPGDPGEVIDEACCDDPFLHESCIRLSSSFSAGQWGGIYWQYPENNWGDYPGYDLSDALKLVFWAKGASGGEKGEFKVGGIADAAKPYQDSFSVSTGVIELIDTWKRYELDLSGQNLSMALGGFCWVTSHSQNPSGCTIYLDEIRYVREMVLPEITDLTAVVVHQPSDTSVNISCMVSDDVDVDVVKVHVVGPEGFVPFNVTMKTGTGQRYYDTRSYSLKGNYEFFIWAIDTSGNSKMSSVQTFSVPKANEAPVIVLNYPVHTAEDVERPPAMLNASVVDPEGTFMDVYLLWRCLGHYYLGEWLTLSTVLHVGNGTYGYIPMGHDWIWGNTTYTWSVNVTDGIFWTNRTFTFTTGGSRYDVNNDCTVNFIDAGKVWVHRTSQASYDGLYDVNQDGDVNFVDAGKTWVNRD